MPHQIIPGLFSNGFLDYRTYTFTQSDLALILGKKQSYISNDVKTLTKMAHPINGENYMRFMRSTHGLNHQQSYYVFLLRLWMDACAIQGVRGSRDKFLDIANTWEMDESGRYYQPLLVDFICQVEKRLTEMEGKKIKLLEYFQDRLQRHLDQKNTQRAYTIEPAMV